MRTSSSRMAWTAGGLSGEPISAIPSIPLMIIPPQQVFDHVHEFLLSLNDKKTED